jgi:hypothetical protein
MPSDWNNQKTWFHGSPFRIEILAPGSTITQDEDLARAFSPKPPLVSLEDDPALSPGLPRIRHNGSQPGLLYRIDEAVSPGDVIPHPNSSMPPGFEWLTRRPLKLLLIGPVSIEPGELLSEQDIQELLKRAHSGLKP